MATFGLAAGCEKELKPANRGRKPLLKGGSCSNTTSA